MHNDSTLQQILNDEEPRGRTEVLLENEPDNSETEFPISTPTPRYD